MSNRFILVMLTLLIGYSTTTAQNALVRGNVYDRDTGEPIIYCNVFLENTTKGTTTDLDGFYTLANIEPGTYIVKATYIGYDTARSEVIIKENSKINRNLYLSESSFNLGTVNISAQREEARTEVRISSVKVSPKQIKALPSVGGEADIAQYLQVLPGVVSTGDQGGQLYIRGGSPVQNKILLDGFPIYNPFHSIGFFSVFETDLIKNVDVLTGGFNAEHGGRISAIVDINTREGNKVRHGGAISASPFVTKATFEGPISKFAEGKGSSSFVLSLGFDQALSDPRNSSIRELGVTLDFSFFGDNSEIKYGLDLRSIRTDFEFVNPFKQQFQQAQNTTELSGYFNYRGVFGPLVIEPSLRMMYYASQSVFSPEPRLGLKYNINDKLLSKTNYNSLGT